MLYMHQSGQRRGEERMNPIFKRTSIRQWTDEPVSREQILDLLKAGMQAPSAVNSQPWEFAVVTDPEVKKRLSEISPYSHFAADAPVIIALLCRKENSCPPYNQIDMGICTENILLEASLVLAPSCLAYARFRIAWMPWQKFLICQKVLKPSA